jgi:hypothetical protein
MNSFLRVVLLVFGLLVSSEALAVDSYRYLHVTIDTPWAIFLFLLPIVLSPFILMVILYWRFAGRKRGHQSDGDEGVGNDNAGK